jgi:hypothetical protein
MTISSNWVFWAPRSITHCIRAGCRLMTAVVGSPLSASTIGIAA